MEMIKQDGAPDGISGMGGEMWKRIMLATFNMFASDASIRQLGVSYFPTSPWLWYQCKSAISEMNFAYYSSLKKLSGVWLHYRHKNFELETVVLLRKEGYADGSDFLMLLYKIISTHALQAAPNILFNFKYVLVNRQDVNENKLQ
jgi:hypothetical protein